MPFLAVASAGASVAKAAGVSFKKPSPRFYGKLAGTITELQEGVEGKTANLNGRTYTDIETVDLMNNERSKDSGMQGIWKDLLPGWNPTAAALARIRQYDPGFRVTGSSAQLVQDQPSGLQLVTEPLRAAVDDSTRVSEAQIREAAAQTAERVGVGGGAAAAQQLRGTSGPLDTLIGFAQKPGGTVILVIGGVVLIAGVAYFAGRN